ncbi:MAG: LL-diaminopimelate aminotransferase [Kiritimatiellae bacterium]|nr:LL-diaminopimelate aminotransferase [Kiritimatiellia bacterium]
MEIEQLFAERIGGTQFGLSNEIYKFEKIKRAKDAAKKARPDVEILDFGVGEPDQIAPETIRETLKKEVDDPNNRGYADNGIPEFRIAASRYMENLFGVENINPETETNHCIGAKPALAMIPLAFINPGDGCIMTTPGYPVLGTHTQYLGGKVFNTPLRKENQFLPDLSAIPTEVADRAKLFYVNYPNNPTGATATETFYDELISFAHQYNLLIIQDAAYATLVYQGSRHSILNRPGGKDVALEVHSMSKSYNMTGWRLGFVVGQALAVKAFSEVKDNIDSGQFKAIQAAACQGIADTKLADSIRGHYEKRLKKLVACLQEVGFEAEMPGGSFFLYVSSPKGAGSLTFNSAEEASQYLIKESSVSTVPWNEAGAFLRFSATFESHHEQDDDRVISELKNRLLKADLTF